MNFEKDEKTTLEVLSGSVNYSRYVGCNKTSIELLARPKSAPIFIPNGYEFSLCDPENKIYYSSGEIKIVLSVVELSDFEVAGSLLFCGQSIEINLSLSEIQFNSLLSSVVAGQLPSTVSCYVKNTKTDDPKYKALKITESNSVITDWSMAVNVIRKLN